MTRGGRRLGCSAGFRTGSGYNWRHPELTKLTLQSSNLPLLLCSIPSPRHYLLCKLRYLRLQDTDTSLIDAEASLNYSEMVLRSFQVPLVERDSRERDDQPDPERHHRDT